MSGAPAYRAGGAACSREAFYAIACDPARSVVVEACAGAGKTWMLVSRLLRALLEGTPPQQILAITFTRKAAAEMRERLRSWLRGFALAGEAERREALRDRGLGEAEAARLAPALAALHGELLAAGRGVQILTFHAWFSQLLRGAPLQLLQPLGLHPGMALIEDWREERPALLRRFHRQVLADAGLRDDHVRLIERHGRSRLEKAWEAMLDHRGEIELAEEAGALAGAVAPAAALWPECAGLAHPAERWQADARLREDAAALARALAASGRKAAQAAAAGLERALAAGDAEQGLALARGALFTAAGPPRKLGEVPGLQALCDGLDRVRHMVTQHEAAEDHERLRRLGLALLAAWREHKRERALADMPDLERCAEAVLGDSALAGWVQERLDARVSQVLIDEFQDTSPLQWHALSGWLGAYAGAGGGASGQRPPSVFIVGDPKQSIYRFRRAEPRVFAAVRRFVVEGLGGVVLECDHTRRNAPPLIEALNQAFGGGHAGAVAPGAALPGFRPHSTEVAAVAGAGLYALPVVPRPPAARGAPAATAPGGRDVLTEPRAEPERRQREAEGRAVAAAVARLVRHEGVPPGEIMLLARRRVVLAEMAQRLRAHRLPVAEPGEQRLADLPPVRDLLALLDVLASPGHDLSLAHALRSPVFGAGDDDLLALAGAAAGAGPGGWWSALARLATPSPALRRAQALLAGWAEAAKRLPPHDLLDRIVHEGDVVGRVLAALPAERREAARASIEALLAQALALDGGRYATPYNFVRALRRRALDAPAPARSEAVRLLTVHGAKGLEARVVFLLDTWPEAVTRHDPAVLVDWPLAARRPRRLALLTRGDQPPPSLQDLWQAEQDETAREELNALYVALTRARERLVLSATEPLRAARAPWWARLSPLAAPWPGAAVAAPADPGTPAGQGAAPAAADDEVEVPTLPPHDAPTAAAGAGPAGQEPSHDDARSRFGQALHRLLEWTIGSAASPAAARPMADLGAAAAAAAAAFGLPRAQLPRLAALAQRLRASEALRPWLDPAAAGWSGNEVPIAWQGRSLRIDRLVRLDAGPHAGWWVLDYKLAAAPDASPALREQLARYRDAVRALQPGETVHAAFVTADGRLLPLDD